MSADERTLGERVADMIAHSGAEMIFYRHEIEDVSALLLEQQPEIERLQAELAQRRIWEAEKAEQHLRDLEALEAARVDAERLLWVFIDTGIDQIGDIDIHARACEINDGEDEMKDASYLQAIREAIDLARARGEG